jgi:hypothetical protein
LHIQRFKIRCGVDALVDLIDQACFIHMQGDLMRFKQASLVVSQESRFIIFLHSYGNHMPPFLFLKTGQL